MHRSYSLERAQATLCWWLNLDLEALRVMESIEAWHLESLGEAGKVISECQSQLLRGPWREVETWDHVVESGSLSSSLERFW